MRLTRSDLTRSDLAGLTSAVALATLLNLWALAQNGYANVYYSAGVKSMLRSWHDFFYLSADPGALVSIDKPPLGLWLQAASAKLFGFSPLSLLAPQAIAGVITVAVLYLIVRRRYGTLAATLSALALAGFPAFVAVSRDNNLDTLLIALMTLACGAALNACETGRLRSLLGAAVLIGLAFNTKALAAVLVVPGIAAAYLLCAPAPLRRRLTHLGLAGALCVVVSLAWIVAVELTPSSQRPFVGSSSDNTELGLAFGYNGFERVGNQKGGPGPVANREVAPTGQVSRSTREVPTPNVAMPKPVPDVEPQVAVTITRGPIAFGSSPGPLRLFRHGFGDQSAWLLAFALIGLLALTLTRPVRRDPKRAALIVFGGFFLCEAVFLSGSKGIVHPYYLSALGPGLAVMVGAGFTAMRDSQRTSSHTSARVLLAIAVLLTAGVQVMLLNQAHYLRLWQILVIPIALAALIAMLRSRFAQAATATLLATLLFAPTIYAATTWRQPVEGTFPAAGPRALGGNGGVELSREQLTTAEALERYVLAHGAHGRFQLLTVASLSADSPILLGLRAAALGGYGGVDPTLDGKGLARLIAAGQARFLLLGGSYAYLGGNAASRAAARVCPQVPFAAWEGARANASEGLYLVDCAGRSGELSSATP